VGRQEGNGMVPYSAGRKARKLGDGDREYEEMEVQHLHCGEMNDISRYSGIKKSKI